MSRVKRRVKLRVALAKGGRPRDGVVLATLGVED